MSFVAKTAPVVEPNGVGSTALSPQETIEAPWMESKGDEVRPELKLGLKDWPLVCWEKSLS